MSQVSFNVLVQGRESPWGTAHYSSYSSFVKKHIGSRLPHPDSRMPGNSDNNSNNSYVLLSLSGHKHCAGHLACIIAARQ